MFGPDCLFGEAFYRIHHDHPTLDLTMAKQHMIATVKPEMASSNV